MSAINAQRRRRVRAELSAAQALRCINLNAEEGRLLRPAKVTEMFLELWHPVCIGVIFFDCNFGGVGGSSVLKPAEVAESSA